MDAEHLGLAFKKLGQGCSQEQLEKFITASSENHNGRIHWHGFLTILQNLYGNSRDTATESVTVTVTETVTVQQTTSQQTPTKTAQQTPTKTAQQTPTKTSQQTPTKTSQQTPTKTTQQTPTKSTQQTPTKTTQQTSQTSQSPKTTQQSSTQQTSQTSQSPKSFNSATPKKDASQSSSLSSHRTNNPTCATCSKIVYPLEMINAVEQVWHKACFRCQQDGCGVSLTLKTFKGSESKIYCAKHLPAIKHTQVHDSLGHLAIKNAPKLQKVSGIQKNVRQTFAPGDLQPVNPDEESTDQ